jgi:FkbM family methyltransferase
MRLTGSLASIIAKSLALVSGDGAARFADWYGQKLLVYPNHLHPISWERVVCTPRGIKMHARFQEVIGWKLILQKEHEPEVSSRIVDTLKPGDVFVDVGANIGYFTLLASQLVGDDGLVMAFEPSHNNLAFLAENLHLNRASNVLLFSAALSDSGGISKLTLPWAFNFGVASLGMGPSANHTDPFAGGFTRTPRWSLDGVLESIGGTRAIRMAKIDAEGHEPQVLRGMEACLKASPDIQIAIELSPESYSVAELCGYMEQLGFAGEFFGEGRWQKITAERMPASLCNAWFSRSGTNGAGMHSRSRSAMEPIQSNG